MSWVRQRLPYFILLGFIVVALTIHSNDIKDIRNTQHELTTTVNRLDDVFTGGTRGNCLRINNLRNEIIALVKYAQPPLTPTQIHQLTTALPLEKCP